MKASDRRKEAAADTRHTQAVEMHFQHRDSMEMVPEHEQRQPGESPRRREPDHHMSHFSKGRRKGKPENSEIITMAQPHNDCLISLKPAELSVQKPHLDLSPQILFSAQLTANSCLN